MNTPHRADVALLNDIRNYHSRTLDYLIESLHWAHQEAAAGGALAAVAPADFVGAVNAVIQFLSDPNVAARATAEELQKRVAYWRGDFDPGHNLAQLGRVLAGDPGAHLEYRGPYFILTLDDALEGTTVEYLDNEWDVADETTATLFVMLSCLPIAEIAVTCYWAVKGQGGNLKREIERVFSRGSREALRGQLANLVVAGQVLSWGWPVEFVSEGSKTSIEWWMGYPGRRFAVECTSYKLTADQVDDGNLIRGAISRAWNEKHVKFGEQREPGIITTDISGIYLTREFGTYLDPRLRRIEEVMLLDGGTRSIGIYETRRDFELLTRESYNRDMLAVLASVLHSRDAQDRNIRGFIAFQAQQIIVDTIHRTMMLPKRGTLAWRGEIADAVELRMLASLFQPAIPSEVYPNGTPAVSYIHLV